jgi:hypothetical protein
MYPPKLFSTRVPCLGLFLALVCRMHGATVTLEPSGDTSLFQGSQFNNLGAVTNLISGTTGVGLSRALLKFNVAGSIPSNATVTSAKLTLRVVKLPTGGVDSNFDLHRLVLDWGEGEKDGAIGSQATVGEATWDDRFFSQAPWTAAGATAPGDFLTEVSSTTFVGGFGSYDFTNLVGDVQFWLSNPASNFGWILISETEGTGQTAKRFGSKEDADPAERPKLVIDYATFQTATLHPVADTTLFELTPDNNMGGDVSLAAGKTGLASSSRALIRFDLTGELPANASIVSARLALNVVRSPMAGAVDSDFDLHRMRVPWIEGTGIGVTGSPANPGEATWNNRAHAALPNAATHWAAPGAAAPDDFVAAVSATQFVTGNGRYVFSDLAGDIQTWLTNPSTNFGWILISQDEATDFTARRFGQREDPFNAPELVIEYNVPGPLHIDSAGMVAGNQFTIQFMAKAGHAYVVECRGSFNEAGTTCTNLPVQAASGPVTLQLPLTGSQRFFRVGEQ